MFNILEISRMTTHNGPGYRTNVHFMGCPLSCKWCSTPESQPLTGLGFNAARCIGCGACAAVCPAGALAHSPGQPVALDRTACTQCFACTGECFSGALWKYGKPFTLEKLLEEILKDTAFFRHSGGGVTFSGGECLMQVNDEMVELYAALHRAGVTIGIDTCGHVPWTNIQRILPYTSFFLWDIKLLDPDRHKQYTGVDNRLILSNLRALSSAGSAQLYIRCPLIPEINDSDQDIEALCRLLQELDQYEEVHFLPFHHLGMNRYLYCGRPYLMGSAQRQSDQKLAHICQLARSHGVPCRIVG